MTLNQITKLLTIGQLAMDLHKANNLTSMCKDAYHDKIRNWEDDHGKIFGLLTPYDSTHARLIAATSGEYAAYKLAKRKAYNIKRRLDSACRRSDSNG